MKLWQSLILIAFGLQTSLATAGTLVGDSIDVSMNRTIDTGYGVGRISGYGLEAPFTVIDGDGDKQLYSSAFTIDVDGSGFKVQFLTSAGWQQGILLRLNDLDFKSSSGYELRDLTINSNLSGYSFAVGSDFIDIGLGGTRFLPSTYLSVAFGTAPIPEPGTFALFSVALATLACARVKSKRT